jgi:hypothetical protein
LDIKLKYENLLDIARSLGEVNLYLNLIVVFLAIVGVYFYERFKKSAELREINNNFTEVLRQQKEIAIETGKINQLLNKESIAFQIRLNSYTQKSIESINDVYLEFIKLRHQIRLTSVIDNNNEALNKLSASLVELMTVYESKKIWIPMDLSRHIDALILDIDKRTISFISACRKMNSNAPISEDRLDKIINTQNEFYDYVFNEINTAFDGLIEKLSQHIGV